MKTSDPKSTTRAQAAELKALSDMSDDAIDTRDIPEGTGWGDARRGVFFRPVKQQLTLRLDADIIRWFRTHAGSGGGYQTRINKALRSYVAQHEGRSVESDP